MDKDTIKEQFLAALKAKAEYQEVYDERRKIFDAEIADLELAFRRINVEVIMDLETYTADADALELLLRELAVNHFNETGEKTLDENLGVRVNTKFVYENDKAVAWAETNAPVMIQRSVDKKSFEKFADGLDFVTVEETVSAVLKGLK